MTWWNGIECLCDWVDIGVGQQRVTDNPDCPEHNPQTPDEGVVRAADFGPLADEHCVVQVGVFQQVHVTRWTGGTNGGPEHCAVCGRLKP